MAEPFEDLAATLPEPTDDQIFRELDREVTQRRRVYKRLVDEERLSRDVAARQLRAMEAARDAFRPGTLLDPPGRKVR